MVAEGDRLDGSTRTLARAPSGFDFDNEHSLGRKHGNGDALSRRPCGRPECSRTTIVIIRPEVQQIMEVLGELKGAPDRSNSRDSEEDSERGVDIED